MSKNIRRMISAIRKTMSAVRKYRRNRLSLSLVSSLIIAVIFLNLQPVFAATVTLYPNGAGSNTGWTWTGGSANYTNWQTNDADTTYATTAGNNAIQTTAMDDTAASGTINSVTAYIVIRHQSVTTEDVAINVVSNGTTYASHAANGLIIGWTTYNTTSYTWINDPFDSQPWTWTDINGLEAGVRTYVEGTTTGFNCTQVYVVVDYTPAVGQTTVFDGTFDASVGDSGTNWYVPAGSQTVQVAIFKSSSSVSADTINKIVLLNELSGSLSDNLDTPLKIWLDSGTVPNALDSADGWASDGATLNYDAVSATFTNLSLGSPLAPGVSTYIITFDVKSVVNGAQNNAQFRLKVSTGSSNNIFLSGDTADRTIIIDTAPPTGVDFSFLTVDSATVVSSSGSVTVPGPSGLGFPPYTISRSSENGNWYSPDLDVGWVSSHTWTGLIPNTTYQFRIKARDNVGNTSVWSSTTTKVTWCEAPVSVSWGTPFITSMTVTWGIGGNNPSNTIYIAQVSSTNFISGTPISSTTVESAGSAIVSSLSANTTYWARVIAQNWQTVGSTSAVTSATKTTLCSPPSGVVWGTTFSTTSIQIVWDTNESPANPANTIYLAEVSLYSNFSPIAASSQSVRGSVPGSVTVVSLSTNTAYYGRVIAQNWETVGSTSTIATSTATLAAVPIVQDFSNVTQSSITVNWQVNGNPSGTDYQCQKSTSNDFTTYESSYTKNTPAIFTGLTGGTTYWFQVKAINQQSISTGWTVLGSTVTLPPNQRPNAPSSLAQPGISAGAWINNQTPTVQFDQSDPDGDNIKFTVQFSTSSDFNYIYHEGVSPSFIPGGTTNYTPIPLPEATSWYWRVRSSDTASGYTSDWSTHSVTVASFRIDITSPTDVGCQWPTDNTYDVKISTRLYARAAQDSGSGVLTYKFRYSSHPALSPWTYEDTFYGLEYQDVDLIAGTTYWWQVRAKDDVNNESDWYANPVVVGSTWSFRTVIANTQPGFTSVGTPSQLSGGATVQFSFTAYDSEQSSVTVDSPNGLRYYYAGVWNNATSPDYGAWFSTGVSNNFRWKLWEAGISTETPTYFEFTIRESQSASSQTVTGVFNIDTLAPSVVTQVRFVYLPLSTQTSFYLHAHFSETNPNTNEFQHEYNGSPSSWASGDIDVVSSTEEFTGFNLKGSDYFTAIRARHTDDFGNSVPSTDGTDAFVRPLEPSTPTIVAVYNTSVTIRIEPNTLESGTSIYFLIRSTQEGVNGEKYVQTDKTLGDNKVWQSTYTAGWGGLDITLTGLSGGTTYTLSICALNPRVDSSIDGSWTGEPGALQFNSTSTFSVSLSTATQPTANQPPQFVSVSASQQTSSTTVTVIYSLSDADNSQVTVTLYYESGAGSTATCNSKSGTFGLVSTGTTHTAYWYAKNDYNNQEKSNMRMYLYADDGLTNGTTGFYTSQFALDTKDPLGSAINFVTNPQSGQNTITLTANWQDPATSTSNLTTPQFAYNRNGGVYSSWANADTFFGGYEFRVNANVGSALAGNEYFSGIKSQASDKKGNGPTVIENITVKYVIPTAPTMSAPSNIFITSMTIGFSSPETAPVVYCIKSTAAGTTDKYVNSAKTLSDTEQWVSTTTWAGWSFVVTGFQGGTTYYISTKAGNPTSGSPPTVQTGYSASVSTVTQPTVNNAPVLSWIDETGYVNDGVSPDTGVVNTTNFIYKVKFEDVDKDTPAAGYPKLKVSLDYSTWTYTMSPAGTPLYNTTYYYQLIFSKTSNRYQYQIVAQDMGSPSQTTFLPAAGLMSGPTVYTTNPIIFSTGTTLVYGVEGSSVNRIGNNVITLKSLFRDNDQTIVTNYSVTFKVSTAPTTGPEYIIVDNKTHKALGETNYSDLRNFVNIERIGSTYTVTYAWDPSTNVPTGVYSLYFSVTDGIELKVDDYIYNSAELYVTSRAIVVTELTKGTQKVVSGKTVCQSCHPHYNRNWPHRDTRVPDYDCLTCHSAHGSDVGKNVQLIRSTITAKVALDQVGWSTMTVIFYSTAAFTNMGTWNDLYPGTTGFGLVSVATKTFSHLGISYSDAGYGPCQVCHIAAKAKYIAEGKTPPTLYYATSTAFSETHGGTGRNCGQCHSHLPNPEITSVSPTYASTMTATVLTIEGKYFDMRISRNPDSSVKLSTGVSGGETIGWCKNTTWKNATKIEATITTNTLVNLSTGAYYITVVNPNGKEGSWSGFSLLSADQFIPKINTFTPSFGSVGTLVTIGGSQFLNSGRIEVKFGTNTASSYWVSNSTVQAVVSTTTPAGWYKITLTNSAGQSDDTADLATSSFNVTGALVPGAKPDISSIWLDFGSAGATFVINGSSFGVRSGQAAVKIYGDQWEQFGGSKLMIVCDEPDTEILRWTNNYIQVKIPSFRPSDILSVNKSTWTTPNTKVIVVSAEGSSSTVSGYNFTLICLPPKVESISPENASQGVSDVPVKIRGKYFSPGAELYLRKQGEVFNIAASNVNLVNISTITGQFSFAVDQTAGDWRVIVRNPDLREPTEQLLFEVFSAPAITSLQPNWSSSDTAKAVTIYGTGFRSTPEVKLSTSADFIPAITVSSRNYESATVIKATFPALTEYSGYPYPLGWYRLKITNPDYYGVTTLEQGYKYEPVSVTTPPPSIASISPAEVYNNVNTTITITGANFISTPTVKIGAPVETVYDALNEIWNSATQMKALIPAGLPPCTTDVSVINFYGTPIASTATLPAVLKIIKGAYTCNDCHNAPTFTGSHGTSHQTHYNTTLIPTQYGGTTNNSAGDKYKFACGKCHQGIHFNSPAQGTPADPYQVEVFFDTSSANPPWQVADATFNITGAFSDTISKLQTDGSYKYYAWRAGRCENLYCHGSLGVNTTNTIGISSQPRWSTNWGTGNRCENCHKITQNTLSGASHRVHTSSRSYSEPYTCTMCHYDTVSSSSSMKETSFHTNGWVNIKLNENEPGNRIFSNSTYAGAHSTASTTLGSYSSKTCDNIYCHSTVQGASSDTVTNAYAVTYQTPTWGTSLTCNSCHPNQTSAFSGSHQKHTSSPWSIGCSTCHYNAGATNKDVHADKLIQVTTGSYYAYESGLSSAPQTAYGGCSNLPSCHGAGQPQWGTTLTCESCHLTTGNDEDDWNTSNNYISKISSSEWNNSTKNKHKQNSASNECTDCHDSAVAHRVSTNPFRLREDLYTDNSINNFCKNCHQNNNISVTTHTHSQVLTGGNNWGQGGVQPTTNTYKCVDCHDPHSDSNTNLLHSRVATGSSDDYGKPVFNLTFGTRTVIFDSLSPLATDYVIATAATKAEREQKICQACHQANNYYTVDYGSTSQHEGGDTKLSCVTQCHNHTASFKASCASNQSNCHGNESSGQYWPDGSAARPDRAGAHQKHIMIISTRANISTSGDAQKQICAFCHPEPIPGGGTGHIDQNNPADVSDTTMKYISGANDGWSQVATYTENTSSTCANSDCHAEYETPNWYRSPTTVYCGDCHGNPGTNTTTRTTLAHTTHTATNGLMGYACSECHPKYNVGISTHLNGYVSMNFISGSTQSVKSGAAYYDKATAGKQGSDADGTEGSGGTDFSFTPYSGSYGQCYNVYCHRPGGTENNSVVKWDEHWTTYPQFDTREEQCGACHEKPPTSGNDVHTVHNNGIIGLSTYTTASNQYQFGCAVCHRTTNDTNIRGNLTLNLGEHARGMVNSVSSQTAKVSFENTYFGVGASYEIGTIVSQDNRGFYSTNGKCNTLYCHGVTLPSEIRLGNSISTPTWNIDLGVGGIGSIGSACRSCHDAQLGVLATTTQGTPDSGSHGAHLGRYSKQMAPNNGQYNYDCTRCHNWTDTLNNATPGVNDTIYHVNKTEEKKFDATLNPGGN